MTARDIAHAIKKIEETQQKIDALQKKHDAKLLPLQSLREGYRAMLAMIRPEPVAESVPLVNVGYEAQPLGTAPMAIRLINDVESLALPSFFNTQGSE